MRPAGKHSVSVICTMIFSASTVFTLVGGAVPGYTISDKGLATEMGYYTPSGKYLGGIPIVSNGASTGMCEEFATGTGAQATSTSTTTDTAVEGTVCSEWIWNKPSTSKDGDIFDVCTCGDRDGEGGINDYYCEEWMCSKYQIDTSSADCTYETDEEMTSAGCRVELEEHTSRCRCDMDEDDPDPGTFCSTWSCETWYLESETKFVFECETLSESELYCEAWTGEWVVDDDEVGALACECTAESGGDTATCTASSCKSKRLSKCSICRLTLSIAAFGVVGLLGILLILHRSFTGSLYTVFNLFCVVIILGTAAGAVLFGGQDGAMYTAIMWVGGAASFMWCCRPPAEDKHSRPLNQVQSVNS